VRHESEWLRGPLAMTDAAVFDGVVLINTAARGLSIAMQNVVGLDGTSALRFGHSGAAADRRVGQGRRS
jgi:hypothetical protein